MSKRRETNVVGSSLPLSYSSAAGGRHRVVRPPVIGVARAVAAMLPMHDRVESASMSWDFGVDVSSSGECVGRNVETGVDAPGSSGRDVRGSPRRDTQASEHSAISVRVPKRPRPHASEDEVQPTRAFGASPGTKRALSELMANNLLRLNVSPMDTSPSGDRQAGGLSTTPPSDSGGIFFASRVDDADGMDSPREKEEWDTAEGLAAVTSPPAKVRGFELSMLDDAGHDLSAPQPRALAGPGTSAILHRRRRSMLSKELNCILPVSTSPLPAALPAPPPVLPSPSRLLGTLSMMDNGAVLPPSSPSAEPSPRGDLRKQAILRRVSLAHPVREGMPTFSRFITPELAAPKLMLPAPLVEERELSEDDDDFDM